MRPAAVGRLLVRWFDPLTSAPLPQRGEGEWISRFTRMGEWFAASGGGLFVRWFDPLTPALSPKRARGEWNFGITWRWTRVRA